jgi:peptidoglycan/LPS O-acetylase OafA/YrhL
LFALACALVVATAVQPASRIVRPALAVAPLRYLGMISYGAYLVHWPIYVWLDRSRVHLHGWPLTFVHLAVAIVVATLSFLLVERPIRRGGLQTWQLRIAIPVGLLLSLVAVFAATRG